MADEVVGRDDGATDLSQPGSLEELDQVPLAGTRQARLVGDPGIELPSRVFIHGFLLGHDGRKMSKSDGNVLDPFEVIDRFGTDALRYYLMRDVAFGEDGSVSMDGVERRYETELANDLGNLASRTIAMVHRYRDGVVPSAEVDADLAAELSAQRAAPSTMRLTTRAPARCQIASA